MSIDGARYSGAALSAEKEMDTCTQHLHDHKEEVQDPRKFFSEVRSLFNEIIMIAAFTGGLQAAILAFFRDLFTDAEFGLRMWPEDLNHPGGFRYSRYSLGMLVGLLSISLSLAVGAIAAINTAIASYFSLHPRPGKFRNWDEQETQGIMQNRVFLCMLVQFMAFFNSGLSLILLTAKLHWPFTIVAAFLGLVAMIISAYHLHVFFEWRWLGHVEWYHFTSLVLCTSALGFDLVTPSKTTWFTFTASGTTLATHMVIILYTKATADTTGNRPHFLAMLAAFFISLVWAGCTVSTVILSVQSATGWARGNMYIVSILAGAEAVLLFGIGIKDAFNWIRKDSGRVYRHTD